jgi:hypothetical protein
MKESYRKGVAPILTASHAAALVKGVAEALTGAQAGRVLSCEINLDREADAVL